MGEYAGDEPAAVAAGVDTIRGVAVEGLLTPLARQYLRETRPWMRFIAVVVFVVVGLTALAGGVMVLIGVASVALPNTAAASGFGAGAALMGLLYLALACLYVAVGVILVRYGRALERLEAGGDPASLEGALKCQKAFWRLVGILTIAGFLAMVLGVLIGIFAAMMSSGPYRA